MSATKRSNQCAYILIVKGSVRFSSFNLADLSLLHLTAVTAHSQLLETNLLISVISASLALGLFLLSFVTASSVFLLNIGVLPGFFLCPLLFSLITVCLPFSSCQDFISAVDSEAIISNADYSVSFYTDISTSISLYTSDVTWQNLNSSSFTEKNKTQ